ncbi:MAG: molybdopterin-dependent oxidoreductase [Adlercreutzia equolifaciens]
MCAQCRRGCGKMECGVWVTVENGRAVKVEGDQSSFQSSGNCCGKSQSSLQAAYHPDRIYHPMKRTNPKGEEPGWQRITWDEAMETIGSKFQAIMDQYGGQSIFNMCGTSRQWVYNFLRVLQVAVRHPQRARGVRDLQGSAPPHGLDQLGRRRPVDGAARRAARVRAVGHCAGELELRRQLPATWWTA